MWAGAELLQAVCSGLVEGAGLVVWAVCSELVGALRESTLLRQPGLAATSCFNQSA